MVEKEKQHGRDNSPGPAPSSITAHHSRAVRYAWGGPGEATAFKAPLLGNKETDTWLPGMALDLFSFPEVPALIAEKGTMTSSPAKLASKLLGFNSE